jgi:hypothetical protein
VDDAGSWFLMIKEDFCTTVGDTALSNSPIFGLLFAYLSPTRPFLSLPTLSPMPATYDSSCLRPAQSTERRFRNHRHQNPTQPLKQCPHQKRRKWRGNTPKIPIDTQGGGGAKVKATTYTL